MVTTEKMDTLSINALNSHNTAPAKPDVTQEQIDIIIDAAELMIVGENNKATARENMKMAEQGQLASLTDALKNYPGVVTEAVWDALFKAKVTERLKGSPSKATLTNRLKRATMGLTLAKEDPSFASIPNSNLKKYAEEVGKKLQDAIDPATGQPRLRSIAKPEKAEKLAEGAFYWLVGCQGDGLASGNAIIYGATADFESIRECAKANAANWKSMVCFTAPKPVPLDIADEKTVFQAEPGAMMNTVVIATSYSLSVDEQGA